MLPLQTGTPDARYRRNVGIMLLNQDGLIWVGRRIDTPDGWQMPQGGIDDGETERDAALRELMEEAGIIAADIIAQSSGWLLYELPEALRGKVWGGKWIGQAQRWFAMRFTGAESDIRIAGKHAEFDAYRWATRAELIAAIVPFKRPVYEAVVAEFTPMLRLAGYWADE